METIGQSLIRQFTRRRFLRTAGIILAITGMAKIFTITGDTTLLEVADPLFGIEFRFLMLAVGLTEILVAGLCFFSRREMLSIGMVAWIASGFVIYRIGIRVIDWERPCGCLGNLSDVFGVSDTTAESIAIVLLGFLFLGSYGFLAHSIKYGKNEVPMPVFRDGVSRDTQR